MKESLVAYLDVLGFRAMVEDNAKHEKIGKYLEIISSEIENQTADRTHIAIESLVFSDTAVLVSEFQPSLEHLSRFLRRIRNLQYACATAGIWLRGGIAFGPLHFDPKKGRIVGKALNKAYDMEKIAIYPRIILEPKIVDKFEIITGSSCATSTTRKKHPSPQNIFCSMENSPMALPSSKRRDFRRFLGSITLGRRSRGAEYI